ncbi:pyrethroid hydrolase [mine drainage metagenome]|uniref:Pyrethroid hydrolase n=1 Tax=mine drainage metagenome TaxID=410659 RepID=A0A1J5R1F4_9ZZZZ
MNKKPKNFVLVHGAFVGSWAVQRLADQLTTRGHRVHAPTLTGLGERSHLAAYDVNLTTHVSDIVNEILWKDLLDDVVLVGMSYSGMVITGVAEEIGDRLASIVYVDACLPSDGQSFADLSGRQLTGKLTQPPDMAMFPFESEAERAWFTSKQTAQPTATFTQKLHVTGAYRRVPRKVWVKATAWRGPNDPLTDSLRGDPDWVVVDIACGHDVANLRPRELAKILDR